jgi:O-antigen ligase
MRATDKLIFPKDLTGQWIAFLFLALIPLVTLIPVSSPMSSWLAQDLALRWGSAFVFLPCLSVFIFHRKLPVLSRLDFADILVLALAFWVLLSVKNSKESFESFYAFRSFLAMLLWWFSLRLLWKQWPEIHPFFERILFGTALLAAGWLVYTTVGRWIWFSYFERFVPREGFFPNPNIAAGFLGIVLIWGALKRLHQGWAPLWGLGFIFLGWCLTQSRGAFLSMILVVLAYCFLHMKEIERRLHQWNQRQWIVAGAAVLIVAAGLAPMVNRLFNALETDPDAYKRLDLWLSILKMATAQPILGFGPGTFQDVYPAFQPTSLWDKMISLTHDEYLQVVVECGFPALLLTLLFLGFLFKQTGSVLLKTPDSPTASPALQASEAAFFILLFESLHNLVDFTMHEWSHRLVLFAFVTYALREKQISEDVRVDLHFSPRALRTGIALLAFFVLWVLGVGAWRDYGARLNDFKSVVLLQGGDLEGAQALAVKSLGFRPELTDPWNSLGVIEDKRADLVRSPKEKEKHFESADTFFQKAIRLSPYSLTPVENEVGDLTKRGRIFQALDLQAQLVERAPAFPTNYLNLGLLQLKVGRAVDAALSADKAIEITPYYLQAYLLKAEALEAAGKRSGALQVYQDLKTWRLPPEVSAQIDSNIQRLEKKQ